MLAESENRPANPDSAAGRSIFSKRNEPEAAQLVDAITNDPVRLISAVSLVETSIVVLNRRGEAGAAELDTFLQEAAIETVAVTPEQAALARQAYEHYGEGRHPAKLNFGDYGLSDTSHPNL